MQDPKELFKPRRFYKREWRRHKSNLSKSVSLPIFKLLPTARPLFDCRRCCSINTLIPLCLWCRWTSEEARREFEESTHHVRARRASTPAKIVRKVENTRTSLVSHVHSSNASQQQLSQTHPSVKSSRHLGSASQHVTQDSKTEANPTSSRNSNTRSSFQDTPLTTIETTVADSHVSTSVSLACSEHTRRPAWSRDIDTNLKSLGAGTLPKLRRSLSASVAGRTQIPLVKTMSTKSLRSAHLVIDFKALHDLYHVSLEETPDKPLFKPEPPQTPQTLRRKKRLSLLRTSNNSIASTTYTADTPSIISHALSTSIDDDVFSVPRRRMKLSSKSSPARPKTADNAVPLGHPRRPLYTAIRSNMSRPTSTIDAPPSSYVPPNLSGRPSRPVSLPAQIRAPSPSPGIISVLSASPFHDDEGPRTEPSSAYRPRSSSHLSTHPPTFAPMSRRHDGFSLSGETELRMRLAEQGQDQEDVFRFKDMGKRRGSMVMNKVRELKKGLKGLVRGNHHAS